MNFFSHLTESESVSRVEFSSLWIALSRKTRAQINWLFNPAEPHMRRTRVLPLLCIHSCLMLHVGILLNTVIYCILQGGMVRILYTCILKILHEYRKNTLENQDQDLRQESEQFLLSFKREPRVHQSLGGIVASCTQLHPRPATTFEPKYNHVGMAKLFPRGCHAFELRVAVKPCALRTCKVQFSQRL